MHGNLLNHVFSKDLVCNPFGFYMVRQEINFSLSEPAQRGSYVLNVNEDGTQAIAGSALSIRDGGRGQQTIVASSTTTTITISAPLEQDYTISSQLYTGPWNMNTEGSIETPSIFRVKPPPGETLHITSITFSIQDGKDNMDDGTFGGLIALTNGIILRKKDHEFRNLFQIINNAGFREDGWDVHYIEKPPSGTNNSIGGKKNYIELQGIALTLNGDYGEEIQLIIQDDLSDLILFAMKVHGHAVKR